MKACHISIFYVFYSPNFKTKKTKMKGEGLATIATIANYESVLPTPFSSVQGFLQIFLALTRNQNKPLTKWNLLFLREAKWNFILQVFIYLFIFLERP